MGFSASTGLAHQARLQTLQSHPKEEGSLDRRWRSSQAPFRGGILDAHKTRTLQRTQIDLTQAGASAGLTCVLETRELTLGTRVDCDAPVEDAHAALTANLSCGLGGIDVSGGTGSIAKDYLSASSWRILDKGGAVIDVRRRR